MKYTLLEMTQIIASSMDSDEINSINDSVESQQIAKIIRNAYFDLINRSALPEHMTPLNLQASGDSTQPVLMTIPTGIDKVEWVKYDNATSTDTDRNMQPVYFVPFEDFMVRSNSLDIDATYVDSMTVTANTYTFDVLYRNDKAPEYYTSYDDRTLLFDSYDSGVDTTLRASKSLAYGRRLATFTLSDSFTPDLDEPQFQLLLNEAKALAWAELKQTVHAKAEQNSRRGWVNLQKSKVTSEELSDFDQLPNFGRRR